MKARRLPNIKDALGLNVRPPPHAPTSQLRAPTMDGEHEEVPESVFFLQGKPKLMHCTAVTAQNPEVRARC